MTTTAHEDQFIDAPEPVRQLYDTGSILRRNVADLEIALKQQAERAEAAEAELTKMREQEPIKYLYRVTDCFGHDVLRDDPKGATILETIPLYAAPVPAPAVLAGFVAHLADDPCQCHCCRTKQRKARALLQSAQQAPAVPALSAPDGDDFNGSTPHLIQCMEALVQLDADGVLVPHGIGRDASKLLSAAANRLRKQTAPIPEEWRNIVTKMLGWWDDPAMTMSQGKVIAEKARALLQSAGGDK